MATVASTFASPIDDREVESTENGLREATKGGELFAFCWARYACHSLHRTSNGPQSCFLQRPRHCDVIARQPTQTPPEAAWPTAPGTRPVQKQRLAPECLGLTSRPQWTRTSEGWQTLTTNVMSVSMQSGQSVLCKAHVREQSMPVNGEAATDTCSTMASRRTHGRWQMPIDVSTETPSWCCSAEPEAASVRVRARGRVVSANVYNGW